MSEDLPIWVSRTQQSARDSNHRRPRAGSPQIIISKASVTGRDSNRGSVRGHSELRRDGSVGIGVNHLRPIIIHGPMSPRSNGDEVSFLYMVLIPLLCCVHALPRWSVPESQPVNTKLKSATRIIFHIFLRFFQTPVTRIYKYTGHLIELIKYL